MIIAAVGLPGSGKTEVTTFFLEKQFTKIYFGDVTFEKMKEEGLEVNEKNERYMREKIRKDNGMAAYAILNYPKIKELHNQGKNVLVESLYSWEEYIYLKERFKEDFKVISVLASQKTRIKRLANRSSRPLTAREVISRDKSQIEHLHQAGPIAIADYPVVNESNLEDLKKELNRIYEELK